MGPLGLRNWQLKPFRVSYDRERWLTLDGEEYVPIDVSSRIDSIKGVSCSNKMIGVKFHIRRATMDLFSVERCGCVKCNFARTVCRTAPKYPVFWVYPLTEKEGSVVRERLPVLLTVCHSWQSQIGLLETREIQKLGVTYTLTTMVRKCHWMPLKLESMWI